MPTVLVTGANRGLGLEFARQYRAEGWEVIAGCRKPDAASELKATGAQVHAVDVSDQGSINGFKAAVGDRPLDVVIANAGVYGGDRQAKLADIDWDAWLQTLNVNTLGPVRIAAAFTENLKAARGKLVAITSQLGSVAENASGGLLAYRSSKSGLNGAFRSVALELKPAGVTAIVMHPGWVQTDMGGKNAPTTPEQSITGMRQVIDALTPEDAGTFRAFDGRTLPW